ncbi:hypothetical protein Ahia01_000598000 [Argonauta hians]
MSYLVPNHLSDDFHRICSLEFANYNQALEACRPGALPSNERSHVIAQDSSGKTRIVSEGNLKKLVVASSPDLRNNNNNNISSSSSSRQQLSQMQHFTTTNTTASHSNSNNNNSNSISSNNHNQQRHYLSTPPPQNHHHHQRVHHNSNRHLHKSYDESDDDAIESVFLENCHISPRILRRFEEQNNMKNWQEVELPQTDSERSSGSNFNRGHGSHHHNNDEITLYEDKGLSISRIGNKHQKQADHNKKIHRVHLIRQSGNCSLGMSIKGGMDENSPITIDWIEEGSLADQQGLRRGDHILEVNGHDFRFLSHEAAVKVILLATQMNILVDSSFAGDYYSKTGTTTTASSTISPVPSRRHHQHQHHHHDFKQEVTTIYPSPRGWIGCVITREGFSGNEVIVKKVAVNSPASKAGLSVGDHILKIDGIDVNILTEKQIVSLMTSSTKVKVQLAKSPYGAILNDSPVFSPKSSLDFYDRPAMSRLYSSDHLSPSLYSSDHGAYGQNYPRSPKSWRNLSSSQPPVWHYKTSTSYPSSPNRSHRSLASPNVQPRNSPNANYLRAVSSHVDDSHLSSSYSSYDPRPIGSPLLRSPGRIYQSRSLSNLARPFQKEEHARKYRHKNAKHNLNPQHYYSDNDSWYMY